MIAVENAFEPTFDPISGRLIHDFSHHRENPLFFLSSSRNSFSEAATLRPPLGEHAAIVCVVGATKLRRECPWCPA